MHFNEMNEWNKYNTPKSKAIKKLSTKQYLININKKN